MNNHPNPSQNPSDQPAANLQAVAKAAGVSAMTVSRCLRNDPRHSAETRARVQKIAADLGYRPNPLAAAFVATREKNRQRESAASVAYIYNFPKVSRNMHDLREGVRQRGRQLGVTVDEFHLEPGGEARLQRIMKSRGIRAVIFAPFADAQVNLDLDLRGMTGVAIGRTLVTPVLSHIECCPFLAAQEACRQMSHRNIRRMGLAISKGIDVRTLFRFKGGFLAWRENISTAEEMPVWVLESESFLNGQYRARIHDWAVQNKLEAVLFADQPPGGAGNFLPAGVPLVHLNLDEPSEQSLGIYEGWLDQGRLAIDTVWDAMAANQFEIKELPYTHQVPPRWCGG